MARVYIPPQLRELTAGKEEVEVEGRNLRQVIAALDGLFPGFGGRVVQGDKIAPGLAVSIDSQITTRGLGVAVAPASDVHFVPAIAGG
jgi:molybdopterin converting factor small subunit